MIRGTAIPRSTRDKDDLAQLIARHLGIAAAQVSTGSTVESEFLGRVYTTITHGLKVGGTTYRQTEAILARLGLTYDDHWDSSEWSPTGGGTITVRAYSQILSALTHPRCFLVPINRRHFPRRYTLTRGQLVNQSTLAEAGPGSRIVFFSEATTSNPFVAIATVTYIDGKPTGTPLEIHLTDLKDLEPPLPPTPIAINGWNRFGRITEIEWDTYEQIVADGLPKPTLATTSAWRNAQTEPDDSVEETRPDLGGRETAHRARQRFHPGSITQTLTVPPPVQGSLKVAAPQTPTYADSGDTVVATNTNLPPRGRRDALRDKDAEVIAVQTTIQALQNSGWMWTADRQKDGIGYDLEFAKGTRVVHVEVKGIIGRDLVFNLTPKERWRAETDPDWILVAVTSVLTNTVRRAHLVRRDQVLTGHTVITGYRVQV